MSEPLPIMHAIPDWVGLYSATADGRIWSHPKKTRRRGMFLQPVGFTGRYLHVTLHSDGVRSIQSIHVLVARTWLPPAQPNQTQVNHKNLSRFDNRSDNLEWSTPSWNRQHYIDNGSPIWSDKFKASVSRNVKFANEARRHLTFEQADAIRAERAAGAKGIVLAARYGVGASTIYGISSGKIYVRK